MKNFYRGNNRFSGGRDFKKPDFDRDRRNFSEKKSMTRTTCSECGDSCEVPFVPTGDRPVYCNKCFERNRSSGQQRNEGRDFREKSSYRFENKNEQRGGNNEGEYKKQLESINWKLDKLLKLLTPAVAPKIVLEDTKEKFLTDIKPKKRLPRKTTTKSVVDKAPLKINT